MTGQLQSNAMLVFLVTAGSLTPASLGAQPYDEKTWIYQEDLGEYSEYSIPKNIYIPGDPILLTDKNNNTGPRINFVACPIHQDSVPTALWLTEYEGETYFIRTQQNFTGRVRHPQLKHKILVEGVISDEPRIGGAKVLNPVNVSILPELSVDCQERRPYVEGAAVKYAKKPPRPGNSGRDRQRKTDRRWSQINKLDDENFPPNEKIEWKKKDFIAEFDFDSEMLWSYPVARAAVMYAKEVDASKIEITSYRGSALLSNGEVIVEHERVAKSRANLVNNAMQDYALPKNAEVILKWVDEPAKATGEDFGNRRVVITITPGVKPTRQAMHQEGPENQ